MTTTPTRRTMIAGGAAGAAFAVTGAMPSLANAAPAKPGRPGPGGRPGGNLTPFPPLQDDPDGVLALPEGFSYAVVTRTGVTKLDDGGLTPGALDGQVAFDAGRGRGRGKYLLVQNHELRAGAEFGVPHAEGTVYDETAVDAGGCTVISTDSRGRNHGETVAISGTLVNCAGGPTPWGTWLTCEETEIKAGETWSGNGKSGTYALDHGYVFEVFADGTALPKPIKAFGRFAHEALAIDKAKQHVFLSEDASGPNGLFYRWTAPRGFRMGPRLADQLADDAGELEAMQILMPDGSILPDVAYLTSTQIGLPFKVSWKKVQDRDAKQTPIRKQFKDGEVTRGKKFEGVWGTDKGVYVVNSFAFSDGDLPADAVPHDGMVWFYDYEDETIQLVSYFPHQETGATGDAPKYSDITFDGPDNVTVTPWGSLVLAEDGKGASHVLSATPHGPAQAIARNQLNDSEFCGPCFTDDGKVLFVNIQSPGLTLAITGPWERYLR